MYKLFYINEAMNSKFTYIDSIINKYLLLIEWCIEKAWLLLYQLYKKANLFASLNWLGVWSHLDIIVTTNDIAITVLLLIVQIALLQKANLSIKYSS